MIIWVVIWITATKIFSCSCKIINKNLSKELITAISKFIDMCNLDIEKQSTNSLITLLFFISQGCQFCDKKKEYHLFHICETFLSLNSSTKNSWEWNVSNNLVINSNIVGNMHAKCLFGLLLIKDSTNEKNHSFYNCYLNSVSFN